jgi:hypothetical protein
MLSSRPPITVGAVHVTPGHWLTQMEKIQVHLHKDELTALREKAQRSGRSIAELAREAIREVVLKPQSMGPVGIWDGEPRRTSAEHDSVHDEV